MLVSSSSTVSRKESFIAKEELRDYNRKDGNAPLTRSSSSSSTSEASATQNDSVQSVPSLFDAAAVPTKIDHGSQLAFTTEELQLTPKSSASVHAGTGSSPVIVFSSKPGSMKSNKKIFVRHGLMRASTSDLLDSINKPKGKGAILGANDPPEKNSNANFQSGPSETQLRARPTVTTILRQQHLLEKAEKKEKAKLELLMVCNTSIFDVDNHAKELGKRQAEEVKAAESKRLLQARLAYEKAIAASRKVAVEKQKIGETTRQKEKEWQSLLEKQRELEKERRKAMAESLQKANNDSKRAFEEMLRSKQEKAIKVKQESEQLQAEARLKKQQEEVRRQDRIQQIQAAKLALRRTKETMGNPNQFYRSIAIPETQIKLRLQKEEDKRKLQETRQKILAAKQIKSVKLIRAMKKIQSFESLTRRQQQEQQSKQRPISSTSVNKLKSRPFTFPGKVPLPNLEHAKHKTSNNSKNKDALSKAAIATKSAEIDEMLEQLKQLRTENYQKRVNEKLQRAQVATSSVGSTVKIVGANVNNKSNDTLKTPNFYSHRSHYGIHV